MFARRLHVRSRASEECDSRSVEAVLDAAAQRLGGEPTAPAASRELEANGVMWAWQMAQLSDADWDRLGVVSLGLKTAVKAELMSPTPAAVDGAPEPVVTDRMRRFLLLPDADGGEAKPLCEMSALFLGLLTTPARERQALLLALCELLALISGLFLSTPFELLNTDDAPSSPTANIWTAWPTRAEFMGALAAIIFIANFMIAMFAVVMALYVAAAGHQADDRFCEGVMGVLGVIFAIFVLVDFLPLLGLCFWRFFTDATSPYPMLGCILGYNIINVALGSACQRFFCGPLALEFYHTPKWFIGLCRSHAPLMGTTHLIAEKPLKAAAERRAAMLRERMMEARLGAGTGTASAAVPADLLLIGRSI